MTNTEKLKDRIVRSGLKMTYIASALGMTYSNFWRMLNTGAEFKPSQINILCDLLRITDLDERRDIFLI